MSETTGGWGYARRLAFLTAGLAPMVFLVMYGGLWLWETLPARVFWQIGLGFAVVLEILYGLALIAVLLAVPVLALLLYRVRRRRGVRLAVARGLVLGVSLALALGLAEGVAAVYQIQARKASVLPAGASGREPPSDLRIENAAYDAVRLPTEFPDPPGTGDIDLVVIGESSAEGVPFNEWLCPGRLIAWQMERALPGRTIRRTTLATSGQTLERQHAKLASLDRRPDLLIIYCGHNEFSARFSWSRDRAYYHDTLEPTVWRRFVGWVERTSPLFGLIAQTAEKCRIAIPPPRGGYRSLVDVPVYTSDEYDRLRADFQRRLEAIVTWAQEIGSLVVLVVPPGNDADFEPNRSFLEPETPRAERSAFARDFRAAEQRENSDPTGAIAGYRALLARQPGFAEAHYRLARLLAAAGDWEAAYLHFVAARDHDGFPMRCPSPFQDAYRAVAARHEDCLLVDGQAVFHAVGRHGILDNELFHDAMHPSLRGHIALAQAVLQALRQSRAFGWPEDSPEPAIDPADCAAHFGLGPAQWERLCHWGIMVYELLAPACHDPSGRLARQRAFADAAVRIAAGEEPGTVGLPNIGIPAPVPLVGPSPVIRAARSSLPTEPGVP